MDDIEGNTSLKRYQGPPEKVGIGKVKPCKTAISHKAQFRMKPMFNECGRKIMKIDRILNTVFLLIVSAKTILFGS
jgi:hypothetical protein